MESFKAPILKIGYATILVPQEEFREDIIKAYKACMALKSPHSIQLATAIKEILLEDKMELAFNDAPLGVTELKKTIINVSRSIAETSQYLRNIINNNCTTIQTLNLLEQYFQKYEETERSTVGINQGAKNSKLMDKTCPDFSQKSGNGIICDECHLKEEQIQNLLRQNKFLNIVADSKITDDMISTFDAKDESSASKIVLLKENEDLYNYLKIYETCLMINSLHALKLAEQIEKKLGDLFIPPDEATINEYGLVYSKFQLKQKLNILFRRLKHNQDFFNKFCKNPSHKLMVLKNIMVCVYNYNQEELNAMEGYATTQERKDDMRREMELYSSGTQRKPLLDRLLENE